MPLSVGAFSVGGGALAERVVRVRLSATVDDYNKGMLEAANATRAVGTEAEKLAQTRQAMQLLGGASLAMGVALAAGVGMAIGKFAEFDQAMSNVGATGEDARANMDALRQAALDAGASTVFSATEAANAIEEMSKAGLSAKDILSGGLSGALDLAAAGGLEVADAAGIAATALKIFNLEGSDMSHVADLLAAGAGKAMGDVSDLSAALAQAGLVANSTGLSIEETTAGLAAFASQGLLGSDAGTSFKTMLGALTPNSAKAADEMERLGVSAYDSQGKFVGLAEFAGNLKDSLAGMTDEQRNASLEIMFGSDAVRAANVLYSEGSEGIEEWTEKVDDSGYAAETAAARLDNLIGDWEAFTGALDTAMISMGEGANGPLRVFVQGLTGLVDAFNGLPDWAQSTTLAVGVLAAGIGIAGGAALLAVPQIADFKNGLITLGVSAARTERLMALLSRAAGVAGVIGVFVLATSAANELGNALADSIGPSAEEVASKVALAKSGLELFQAALERRDASPAMIDRASESLVKVGAALDDARAKQENWFDGISGGNQEVLSTLFAMGEELENLASTDMDAATAQFRRFSEDAGLSKDQVIQLMREMPGFRDAVIKAAAAVGIASDDQSLLNYVLGETPDAAMAGADALAEIEGAAAEADTALSDMVQALEDVARGALDLGSAKDSALSAINSMRDAAADEESALDGTNDASIRLRDSVREVEEAHRASAESIIQNGGTLEEAQGQWAAGRQAVIDMIAAKTGDVAAATAWADANLGSAGEVSSALGNVKTAVDNIPGNKDININANTGQAQSRILDLINSFNRLPAFKNITIQTTQVGVGTVLKPDGQANGGFFSGGVKAFAGGGFEPGIYPYAQGGIHKFAEEYDEAYISLDPARRSRSEAVWVKTGQEMGMFGGPGGGDQSALIAEVRALRGSLSRPNYTVNNPIRRDEKSEHWEAAQVVGFDL